MKGFYLASTPVHHANQQSSAPSQHLSPYQAARTEGRKIVCCCGLLHAGTLAGSTVLLLSLAWGLSVLVGRCDLNSQGTAVDKKLTRGWDLFNTGVTVDRWGCFQKWLLFL